MYLLKFKRKYTTLNETEISKRRSSIENDPRKDPRIDEGKIEGKKKNSETEAEWNKREFPFLGLGFSRWEAKQLKSLARVNLVQLSAGCRWKEREICSYPSTFRDVVVPSPDKRRESRGHNLSKLLSSEAKEHVHFIHRRCQLGWWPINTGTIQMKLPLSPPLSLSLAPFKANRYSCNALIPWMRCNAIPRNEKCGCLRFPDFYFSCRFPLCSSDFDDDSFLP